MDHIDKVLTTMSGSHRFSPSICAALVVGKNAINRYYNKTDHSETYRIAMSKFIFIHAHLSYSRLAVLHPRHKLSYFKAQGWEDSWIDTAHTIIRDEYDRSYASARLDVDSDDDYIAVGSVDNSVRVLFFSFLW